MHYKINTVVLALLMASCCAYAIAADAPLGDMAPYKKIAEDTLKLVEKNDMKGATARIKDLETEWDKGEETLKKANATKWTSVDKSIDRALALLRSGTPEAEACTKSLKTLIAKFDAIDKK